MLFEPYFEHSSKWTNLVFQLLNSPSVKKRYWSCGQSTSWLGGGQGWIRAPFFLFYMCGRAIHITHWVCKKSVPFLRTEKIGYFRASNSQALGMLSWAGSSQRPSTKCRQRLSVVRSLGRPCPLLILQVCKFQFCLLATLFEHYFEQSLKRTNLVPHFPTCRQWKTCFPVATLAVREKKVLPL